MSESSALGPQALLVDGGDALLRPRVELHPGVEHTILWRQGRDVAGLLWIQGGFEVPEHTHGRSEHHVWVLAGRARIGDRTVGPGSYWHVPVGVPHHIAGVAPEGCTIAYQFVSRVAG